MSELSGRSDVWLWVGGRPMIATILSFVLGAVIGLRFKVFVLLLVIFSGLVVGVAVGIARAADFWSMVLTMIIASAAFQLGYLSANALLFFIGSGRSSLARPDGAVHRGEPAGQHAAATLDSDVLRLM